MIGNPVARHCDTVGGNRILYRFRSIDSITMLFRSVSFSLFRSENWQVQLRLLCVIEVLKLRSFYDTDHADFYPQFKADMWLQLPSFVQFVCSLVQLNSYCDMLAVLAASSVTNKAIQTLWPIPVEPGQLFPFTKLVLGREIAMCRHPLQIMWTVSTYYNAMPPITLCH